MQVLVLTTQICQNGFVLENETCQCTKLLSSDGMFCVDSCSEINENLLDGKCSKIQAKTTPYCTSDSECKPGHICFGTIGTQNCQCGAAGWALDQNYQCANCWANNQISYHGQCTSCSPGSKFSNGECVCQNNEGFAGTYPNCNDCWGHLQVIQDNQCQECPQGSIINQNTFKCQCDQAQGYAGDDPLYCLKCSDVNKIIVNNQCQACPIGLVFDSNSNKCICDPKQGYIGGDPNQCQNCWGNNKIISNGECVACAVKNAVKNGICVCDNANGFVGVNPNSCTNCWENQKEIVSDVCVPCETGAKFDLNKHQCMCDEALGYTGNDASSCQDCWTKSMIFKNSKCTECSEIDIYSVYDVDNNCKCLLGYILKNEVCQKSSSNQTIAIAVAVPAAVILLSVVATTIIIKKKKALKLNTHIEAPTQAQSVQ
ncbi:putative_folate-biopterin transporter 2 [Hexamita inflata]|uniref:Folate-biopterin transporter 2 n=1 Tax=Hexamita inflata TaxID=28002 RepID=A0AA86UL69_9EUKA|nr:putative folate-biopterin transporter 2 [Hexamita inflata]